MNQLPYIFIALLLSCGSPDKNTGGNIIASDSTIDNSEMTLLEHVRLAINPKFQDWVLFENGTYIIFDNADTIVDINAEAIMLMKEYGPVHSGSPAGDFSVTHLNQTEGWIVSGHCYGMYTYVSPMELEAKAPNDAEIGIFGRSKREKDGKNPVVIHTNRKE